MEKLYLFLILFSLNIVILPGISGSKEERPQIVYRPGAPITPEIIKAAWYNDQDHWICDPNTNKQILPEEKIEPQSPLLINLMRPGKIATAVIFSNEITEKQIQDALKSEQKKWNYCPYTRRHDMVNDALIEPRGKLLRCLVGIKD